MPKPTKRHEALKPLSREHHHGLLLSWKIRTGMSKGTDVNRIMRYAVWFYENHLIAHFAAEEKFVFPLLGNEHEFVIQAIAEHRRLESLFNSTDAQDSILNLLEKELVAHIRFEERTLFNEIQKLCSESELVILKEKIKEPEIKTSWDDEFWL